MRRVTFASPLAGPIVAATLFSALYCIHVAAAPQAATVSLVNSTTMVRNSANFDPNNPVGHLWDGCLSGSASCTAGGMGIGSFWIEFDFGALQNLTSARLFGDASGAWWTVSWTLQYKSNSTDPWSTAFSNANAFADNWSAQTLSVAARYVRVEVFGNPATRDTEARELEIYGTPASVNQPPAVNAGPDQTITLPASAALNGTATDDGMPAGSAMTTTWSKVTGPGTVAFGNINARSTSASFSAAGAYVLRLTGSDGALSSSNDLTITANAAPTAGTVYYVNVATGNDANGGTSTAPWRTIQKAANTLRPGETVTVSGGTYNERVLVSISGTSGNLITFQAQGTVVMLGFRVQASYIKVNGFEIANLPYVHHTNRSTGAGIYVSGNNNQISNNYVHQTPAAAIYLNSSGTSGNLISGNRVVSGVECGIFVQGSNNLIVSNDVSHTRSVEGSDADGIRFFGTGNIIRKNYVHDIVEAESPGQSPHIDAIQTWGPADNITFEQNIFDIQGDQMQGSMISISINPVQNLTFRNNIFINGSRSAWGPAINIMGYSGSSLGSTVYNVTVVNNTFIRTGGNDLTYCVVLHDGVQNATVMNNAFYNCGGRDFSYVSTNAFYGGTTSGITFRNNSVFTTDGVAPAGGPNPNDLWMLDPRFASISGRNFHLQSVSPLINRGATVSQVANDYDGVARPQDTVYDIGAFEYTTGSSSSASLVNSTTMIRNSANFDPNNPVENLWDGCLTGSASCTAGGVGIGSFWIEFDFGALQNLSSARLFGDADDSWWSSTWTLQYKSNAADPWTTAFSNVNAFLDNWSTQSLAVTARYVRVEVFGNPGTRDTEARELEIYGTPAP
ncbi:MAG TPA: right-handed parallel beta-helix repeat-containing protein [Terriglobia bacterium]|nr:right-handed parallel beta-helix repeat-containing protein [Terriglobia bacterium]